MKKKLIALDIDGVLLPTAATQGRQVYSIYNSGVVPNYVVEAIHMLQQSNFKILWFSTWDEETANDSFLWLLQKRLKGISLGGSPMLPIVEQKKEGLFEFLEQRKVAQVAIFDDQVLIEHEKVSMFPIDPRVGLRPKDARMALDALS